MKKTLKMILLGALILLVASYGLLQTAPVKNWLAGVIAAQLSTPEQHLQISRLRGHIPWNINIQQLRIKSGIDDVLIADDVVLDWRLLRLARGELVINSLKARRIEWLKAFPKRTKTKQSSSLQTFPNFAIGDVAFPEIIIAKGLAGAEELRLQFNIKGDKNKMMHFKGQMLVQKGINTELLFNFAPNSNSSFLADIALNEEAGGLVGSLLKLPANQAIHMKALLKGDLQSLGGGFNLRLGDELLADLSITTDYANHLQIVGTGILPSFIELPELIKRREWQFNAGIARNADLWQIEAARLQLANVALDLTGEVSNAKASLKPSISATLFERIYEASGDVMLDFDAQTLNANMAGELPNLPQFQKWLGDDASIAWSIVSEGALKALPLELKLVAKNINPPPKLAHLKLGNKAIITAVMNGKNLNAKLQAGELNGIIQASLKNRIKASLELKHKTLPAITADATLKGAVLEELNINAPKTILTAQNLSKKGGVIALKSKDIAALAAWLGLPNASGAITANADIAAQNTTIEASKLNLPQYDLSITKFDAALTNGAFATSMVGEHAGEKIALAGSGVYAKTKQQQTASINKLSGEYGEHNFQLKLPTKLIWAENNWQLGSSIVEIAGATVQLQGKQTADEVDIKFELPSLPLRPFMSGAVPTMGKVDLMAKANITGKPSNPLATFSASIIAEEMSKIDKDNTTPQQLALRINGKYAAKMLMATTALTSGVEQLGNGNLALPLEFSLRPFALRLREKPMQAGAHLEVAMSRFNSWLSPLGHRIKANLAADFKASGDALNPTTNANIAFTDFNYTNLRSGVCLRHGEMQAKLTSDRQFILQSFKAKGDRDVGDISASGQINLKETNLAGDTVNFTMHMQDAAIFCTPLLEGAISGDVKLAGNEQNMQLNGDLQLGKTSILIPSGGKTAIPKVERVYRHELARQKLIRQKTNNQTVQASPLKLDLKIDASRQVFVRGRGLDAEFGGNLHIIGNANAPKIEGKLASRRGRLALLGSTMQINEGVISFMNGLPQKPYIQLVGSTKTNNTQINVELEGAVLKPKLNLSSTPSLPQDEILALLLFGKPLEKISPFQALQLAQAAASLASGESGTGMLGSAREVLGVDSLNVGEGSDGRPTIGAGKYVTDKVFVGIEQGTTPESRRISTEIEISPTVTGKTSTNSQGEPTLGLEWRYDY